MLFDQLNINYCLCVCVCACVCVCVCVRIHVCVVVPTVLSKMHLALRNENLTEKVAEQCFVCLKEEWMK